MPVPANVKPGNINKRHSQTTTKVTLHLQQRPPAGYLVAPWRPLLPRTKRGHSSGSRESRGFCKCCTASNHLRFQQHLLHRIGWSRSQSHDHRRRRWFRCSRLGPQCHRRSRVLQCLILGNVLPLLLAVTMN